MKRRLKVLANLPILIFAVIWGIIPSFASEQNPLTCNMSVISGDDDGSFQMTLPFSLQLGTVEYNQVYYSTNGLMSFGQPDGNFWSYPSTPSVTLAGRDWVSWGPGAYTSYGYNESSFCIEWSVRPFPQSSGDLTQIRLVVNRFPNGAWHGEITTLGWIPPDIRRGIVWEQGGTPLPIEAAFDVNGGVPIEVEPAPQPSSFTEPPAIPTQCWDGTTVYAPVVCPIEPSPTPTETPTPTIEPTPTPSESQTVEPTPLPTEPTQSPSPTQEPTQEPSPTPTPSASQSMSPEPVATPSVTHQPTASSPVEESPAPIESPTPDLTPVDIPSVNDSTEDKVDYILENLIDGQAVSADLIEELGIDYEDLPPDTPVELPNGVILTAEVADALEVFENIDDLFASAITDPGKVVKALANIGADMTPEKRDQSQKVVVAAVIAGQLMNALSAANMIGRKL